jgi:predicted RNA methylase
VLWSDAHAGAIDQALRDPTAIGWMHQYWVNADKTGVAAKLRRKAGDTIDGADLIAATSIYSSRQQVRFLLQHAMSRVWRAEPRVVRKLAWEYVAEGDVQGGMRPASEVTVLDPACGCGHFLVEALRMLVAISLCDRPDATAASVCREVLAGRLFGIDIDPRAVRVAKWAVSRTAYELCGQRMTPRNIVLARGLGSLKRAAGRTRVDAFLGRTYTVVATNPPFAGFRKLSSRLKTAIASLEPAASGDLAAAFISRGVSLVESGGVLAVVTPAAWLSSSPALPLRRRILAESRPRVIATLGQRVFETAPLLFAALAVVQRGLDDGPVEMLRASGEAGLITAARRSVPVARIVRDPSMSLSPMVAVLPVAGSTRLARVGDFFDFFDGVWAGDTARDTREASLVAPTDPNWVPVSARHGASRWYSPDTRVIRASLGRSWPHAARREGCLEYSRVAGGRLAARAVFEPTVAAAGVVSMTLRPGVEDRRADVLAVFNSRVGTLWLRALVSGLNFNPGYAARVALPADGLPGPVRALVWEAVEVKRAFSISRECETGMRLERLEAEIDQFIAEAMGVSPRDLQDITLGGVRTRHGMRDAVAHGAVVIAGPSPRNFEWENVPPG